MTLPTLHVVPVVAALVVLLAATLGPLLLYRTLERRERTLKRERRAGLEPVLAAFSLGDSSAGAVRLALRESGDEALWEALEHTHLPRVSRRRLGMLLERSRVIGTECRALRHDAPARQELAAQRLGRLDSRRTRRALRRAMGSDTEHVAAAATLALARLGDRKAFRFVLEHPQAFARRTRRFRATLLRAFGSQALPLLHDALESDALDPTLGCAILDALGSSSFKPAAASIARRLRDGEPELRVAAARALGQIGTQEHTVSLRKCLEDAHWPVRAQAAKALGRIRAHHCEDALAARLTDPAWWVRRHAAYALEELGEPGHAALLHVSENSSDPYAREMANEVLAGGWLDQSA